MGAKISVSTCLWFQKDAEQAAELYVSLFEDAKITNKTMQGDTALTVDISLNGHHIMLLNGGPHFKLTEAASIMAVCDSDADCDRLWNKLTADGGKESQCSWLVDRFGVSWQIIPSLFLRLAGDKDATKVKRMFAAMMSMKKLDMNILQKAFDGTL